MPAIIVVGDRTSHGGVVIDGSPETGIDGKPVARVGDHVTCPLKGHGEITVIASGDPTLIVDGAPVARHGDKTACGATLLSSQMTTTDDAGSGVKPAPRPSAARSPGTRSGASDESQTLGDADQYFLLRDEATKAPLKNRLYRIHVRGNTAEGRTDQEGKTQLIAGSLGDQIKIEVFAEDAGA